MKKIYLSLLVLTSVSAMAQNWVWAKDRNTNNSDVSSRDLFKDAADNIYVLNADRICKYNSAGNSLWTKNSIAVNFMDFETDKIYTSTQFTGTLAVGTNTFTSRSYYDMVVTKWDSSFNTPAWSVQFKGSVANGADKVYPLNIKTVNGFTYVLGNFDDSLIVNTTALAAVNHYGTFITKLDASGNIIFVKSIGYIFGSAIGQFSVEDMEIDATGNIYFAGMFEEANILGTLYLANHTFPYGSYQLDPFYMKLDNSGTPVFFRSFSGSQQKIEKIKSIKLDGNNILVAGTYEDSLHINSTALLAVPGSTSSAYIASLDIATGNSNWVKNITSSKSATAASLVTDASGNIYFTGAYQADMLFNGTAYATANATLLNGYILKLNNTGSTQWSNLTGDYYQSTSSILLLNSGDVVIGGNYSGPFTFSIGTNTLPGTLGYSHPFLARSSNAAAGIKDNSVATNQYIPFPNPSTGKFKILSNENIKQVNIFDVKGGLIKTFNQDINIGTELEITESGIYFLQIITDKQSSIKKIIINN
ncbi:MAG: T9SS type A sorting domain-containing protein [Bacteroidia bacterium]